MIYEPPTKEDDCSPWSCKTIKWADDVIPNLCSPVLHNDDIDKRCDDNTIITHDFDFDVPQEIHISEEDDDMHQLISCVRPSRWKSNPACVLGAYEILEYVMQPIRTIMDHVIGSCDDEPNSRNGSTNKIKRWESKSKANIDKGNEEVMFSKLLKWSSDEEDASGEGFLTSESEHGGG